MGQAACRVRYKAWGRQAATFRARVKPFFRLGMTSADVWALTVSQNSHLVPSQVFEGLDVLAQSYFF